MQSIANSRGSPKIDMTIISDYYSHMKVKVADLKANLSRHLRQLQKTGEPIEVCVREDSVAYLTPASAGAPDQVAARQNEALRARLHTAGLVLTTECKPSHPLPAIQATIARDGRTDVSTVSAMRAERDW